MASEKRFDGLTQEEVNGLIRVNLKLDKFDGSNLNDCNAAEAKLLELFDKEPLWRYMEFLSAICSPALDQNAPLMREFLIVHASPRQKCKALLMAFDLCS